MKKTLLLLVAALAMMSCGEQQELRHPKWAYDATIYELNTRQATEEGTFAAAEELLPTLKENGIDIIWVMPCQPIGKITRKGTLGSYYSIIDYCEINPEFGTREDFEHFLAQAHKMGFKVILDWVANHTAPDSEWTKNEGWHYRDSLGNLMVQYDWTDISKLNYDNQDMRQSHPDMFTLAEDEDKAQELTESAFDMYYGWSLHHLMNGVAQGKNSVEDLWANFAKADSTIRPEAIRMNFISNHDENSWNGTEQERMGEAVPLFQAFCYVVPGMPMIYTGQLSGNHHRLEFFEKDMIDKDEAYAEADLYHLLNGLRERNKSLFSPEAGAPMVRIATDNEKVFACVRQKEGRWHTNTVIAVMNMSGEEQTVMLDLAGYEGTYKCLCGKKHKIETAQEFTLAPWQFKIFER